MNVLVTDPDLIGGWFLIIFGAVLFFAGLVWSVTR